MQNEKFPAAPYKKYLMNELFKKSLKRSHSYYMLEAHKAHCIMLSETGIITKDVARNILKALSIVNEKLKTLNLDDFTGEEEDLYFIIEKIMIDEIGLQDAGALHTGRSRNDLGHTIFRMAFRDELISIIEDLSILAQSLYEKGIETRKSIITAWTHCQPAQPTTYGHYLGAILESLIRELERLMFNFQYVDCSPYGSAAITTTGFPINRETTAQLLGFIEPVINSYGGIASADYLLNSLGIIKSLAVHLGKFSVDQLDWARMEIGQIIVPDSWVQKSSIMPQKRNAVVFEHLRARFSAISSLCDVPGNSMKNTPFGDIDDIETEFHEHVHEIFDIMKITIPMISEIVKVIKIHPDNPGQMIDRSCLLATELADSLVRTEGINFKQAHGIAAVVSKYCTDNNISLTQIPDDLISRTFESETGLKMKNDKEKLKQFLTPEYFVEIRTVLGGPSPAALDSAYNIYDKKLIDLRGKIQKQRNRHMEASVEMERRIKLLN